MDDIPSHIYSGFIQKYLLGKLSYLTNGQKIYDSTYYGYSLTDTTSVVGYLMIRDNKGKGLTLGFDSLDTKGVQVDLSDDEMKKIVYP